MTDLRSAAPKRAKPPSKRSRLLFWPDPTASFPPLTGGQSHQKPERPADRCGHVFNAGSKKLPAEAGGKAWRQRPSCSGRSAPPITNEHGIVHQQQHAPRSTYVYAAYWTSLDILQPNGGCRMAMRVACNVAFVQMHVCTACASSSKHMQLICIGGPALDPPSEVCLRPGSCTTKGGPAARSKQR